MYIVILENSKRFIPNGFGEDKILKESKLKWHSTATGLARVEKPYIITQTKAYLKDY